MYTPRQEMNQFQRSHVTRTGTLRREWQDPDLLPRVGTACFEPRPQICLQGQKSVGAA